MSYQFSFDAPRNVRIDRSLQSMAPDGDSILMAVVIVLSFLLICALIYTFAPFLMTRPNVRHQHNGLVTVLFYDDQPQPDFHQGIRERLQDEADLAGDELIDRISEGIDNYYAERERHDNDSQNVHEPVVVKCQSLKYRRLLELRVADFEHRAFVKGLIEQGHDRDEVRSMEIDQADREIRKYVQDLPPERRDGIIHVLDDIGKGGTSISLTSYPVKDIWVLTMVWQRIHHKSNQANVKDMEVALMDQLFDASHGERDVMDAATTVCIGGRIGRILSCLTHLDSDHALAAPEIDLRELTNITNMKCAHILKTRMTESPEMAALYVADRTKISAQETARIEKFESDIKKEIEDEIRKECSKLVSVWELETLVENAKAGI